MKKILDNNKFKKLFSKFRFTHLNNGISETVKFYEKELNKKN